ncbi:META domain-containing protein [Thiocystis violacea]|uniref:META domain-containing protein n=1 Tax=Thiocystis violacea TaxID=13725 RepID=UPI0019077EB1|nr:META domain-containing protein [Thiocystis violacea]MBK1720245.1 hypothetical protein [Thiocystis violacea]
MRQPLIRLASAGLALLLSGPIQAADLDVDVEPTQEARPPATFEGSVWRLSAYQSSPGLVEVVPNSRPTRFRFEAGRMSGSTGCNQIQGSYRLDGAIITFENGLAATQMGCPPPLMAQEKAIIQAIKAVATYRHEEGRLELLDAGGKPLLRFASNKPADLEGRVWKLDRYDNGQKALVTPVKGSEISLTFDTQGRIGGSDGCNRYMSGFRRDGDTLSIGPIATTRMACQASDGRAEQARSYASALGRVTAFRIEGDQLTLLDADGGTAAHFQAEASIEGVAAAQ